MNNRFFIIAPLLLFMAGCSDDNSSYETPDTTGLESNPGTISQTNFSLLTADVMPAVIDATTGVFSKTDVELTVYIGDRNNQSLTDAHTVYFVPEYGLVDPSSCVTEEGKCSVTWSAIKRPDVGGPGSDGRVTITAYTAGEEGFTDTNGNSLFDDNDAGFDDLEEPYVDVDESNGYNAGDTIIDVVSINDPTGANGVHDIADGFFNGNGCTHTSLCGYATSIAVFDMVTMSIIANATYTIGGIVTGIPASESLVIQNNDGNNLTITANGDFQFSTAIADGETYTVTVLTPPPGAPTCTVTNETGTVSGADVSNVTISCS
jgi:hypothetical protein